MDSSSRPNETPPNSAAQHGSEARDDDKSKSSDGGSAGEAAAVATSTTVELAPVDSDVPMSVLQIANSYEAIDEAMREIKNAPSVEPPSTIDGEIAAMIDDQEAVKMNAEKNSSMNATANQDNHNHANDSCSEMQQHQELPAEVTDRMNNSLPTSDDHQDQPATPTPTSAPNASIDLETGEPPAAMLPPSSSSVDDTVYDYSSHIQAGAEVTTTSTLVQPAPGIRSSNDQSAQPIPEFHEVQATAVDAQIYNAVLLQNGPVDPPESDQNNNTGANSSWRVRYQKQIFIVLVLIIGALGGIVGTLLAFRGNGGDESSKDGGGTESGPGSKALSPGTNENNATANPSLEGSRNVPGSKLTESPTYPPSTSPADILTHAEIQSQRPSPVLSRRPTESPTIPPTQIPIQLPTVVGDVCLLVTTGSNGGHDGPVDIFVNSGSGYKLVTTPKKEYSHGEIVIDECFDLIEGVQVINYSTNGWVGFFELSTDGKERYNPLICADCTGTTSTMPISVDYDSDDTEQLSTFCFAGNRCSLIPSPMIWEQMGETKIGKKIGDSFGGAVELSGDASILAVAAGKSDDNGQDSGQVNILKWDNQKSSYEEFGKALDGSGIGDNFGSSQYGVSLALSSDGTTLVVGSKHHDGNGIDSGHVRLFSLGGTEMNSTTLVQEITSKNANDLFGYSVAMSRGGNILAVSAPGNRAGYVNVYNRGDTSSDYELWGDPIEGEVDGDRFGHSLALSADGSTLAVGTPWSDGNRGFVQVYQLIDDKKAKWEELGQSITGEGVNDGAGFSLAISELGNILAIGAPSNNSDAGYVKVYEFRHDEEPIWKQRGTDIVGKNGERLGESISLSALGDILGIGAMKNNYSGENSGRAVVYWYDKVELDYKQLGTSIFGREADGYFGVSVDVSSDGMSLAIGGHGGWLDYGWSIPGYAQVYKFKNSTLAGKWQVGWPNSNDMYYFDKDSKGPKCPDGLEVSESECVEAADQLGLRYDEFDIADWDYTPCGCFLYRLSNGGLKLNYDKGLVGECTTGHSKVRGLICKQANPSLEVMDPKPADIRSHGQNH